MKTEIIQELEIVRKNASDGILRAEDVVEYARDESTSLHSRFEWDEATAAHDHRVWQARKIISVAVTMIPQSSNPVRAYVSLSPDRTATGGGYTPIVKVLRNKAKREQMLVDALADFRVFEGKYNHLRALVPLFAVAKKIKKKAVVVKGGDDV